MEVESEYQAYKAERETEMYQLRLQINENEKRLRNYEEEMESMRQTKTTDFGDSTVEFETCKNQLEDILSQIENEKNAKEHVII